MLLAQGGRRVVTGVGGFEHAPGPLDGRDRSVGGHVDREHGQAVELRCGYVGGWPGDPGLRRNHGHAVNREDGCHHPGRAVAGGGDAGQLGARDQAARYIPEALREPQHGGRDGQAAGLVDREHPADAAGRLQPVKQRARRGRNGDRLGIIGKLVYQDARRRPVERRGALGILRGDESDGHGGDEQGEDQAAHRAEPGLRVVGEPADGDQHARPAGPPGHEPGPGQG